ncbi:MAG: hypothetical protein Q7T32_00835 [Moraxellaceae bacterium]|nr:hypothetical protein [Moraxellaceae bacterium]
MSISQKKIAIEGALTPYLSDDHLMRAICIWEEKYSQQPTFALQRFINEFCDNATLIAQRSQILQSLIRALSGADGRPRETAPIRYKEAAKIPSSTQAVADESIMCFSALIESIFANTPGDMHIKMRLFLIENLPGMKLPAMAQRALHAWLSQQYRIPDDVRIEEKALRHLINLAYISLCEYLGPVKADRLLHDAITATEERSTFPVRQLL